MQIKRIHGHGIYSTGTIILKELNITIYDIVISTAEVLKTKSAQSLCKARSKVSKRTPLFQKKLQAKFIPNKRQYSRWHFLFPVSVSFQINPVGIFPLKAPVFSITMLISK